jgi:hypothetical protein
MVWACVTIFGLYFILVLFRIHFWFSAPPNLSGIIYVVKRTTHELFYRRVRQKRVLVNPYVFITFRPLEFEPELISIQDATTLDLQIGLCKAANIPTDDRRQYYIVTLEQYNRERSVTLILNVSIAYKVNLKMAHLIDDAHSFIRNRYQAVLDIVNENIKEGKELKSINDIKELAGVRFLKIDTTENSLFHFSSVRINNVTLQSRVDKYTFLLLAEMTDAAKSW